VRPRPLPRGFPFPLAVLLLAAALFPHACASPPPDNVVILCAGDSLTETGFPRRLKRLLERDGVRARVLNYGRSGNTSGEYLRFLEGAYGRLEEGKPDFILLQLGTNDVRLDGDRTEAGVFEENMRRILAIFSGFKNRRGAPARVFLALIPPVPPTAGYPFGPESSVRVVEEINPILRRLADKHRLVLVDNYTPLVEAPELLPDVHPTDEGYRLLAASWHAALKPHLPL